MCRGTFFARAGCKEEGFARQRDKGFPITQEGLAQAMKNHLCQPFGIRMDSLVPYAPGDAALAACAAGPALFSGVFAPGLWGACALADVSTADGEVGSVTEV